MPRSVAYALAKQLSSRPKEEWGGNKCRKMGDALKLAQANQALFGQEESDYE